MPLGESEKNGNGSKAYVSLTWLNNLLLYVVAALMLGGITMLLNTVTTIDGRLETLEKTQLQATWTSDANVKLQAAVQSEQEARFAALNVQINKVQVQMAEIQRTLSIQEDWISAQVHADRAISELHPNRRK